MGILMKIQLIGLGNVGRALIELIENKRAFLKSLGVSLVVVSISDSKGTAMGKNGLNLAEVLKYKERTWKNFSNYIRGYGALDAIKSSESDAVVELTPTTPNGEPGLSNIKTALSTGKNVVTANKGPLVVAYDKLVKMAAEKGVRLFYEATVAAHLPVFCMVNSCFKVDELVKIEGILNATTNFIIGGMENGRSFEEALNKAKRAGWAETNYHDDVDGIDAARKVVIMANSLFNKKARLEDVQIEGIRNVEPLVRVAAKTGKKTKLICKITKDRDKLRMSVMPQQIPLEDPLATVNHGDMGIKFTFTTSKDIFVSAQFKGPTQTAYAVLNDIIKLGSMRETC